MSDVRLWHPWLRINRIMRVMLHTRWSAEAWAVVWVGSSGRSGVEARECDRPRRRGSAAVRGRLGRDPWV